MPSGVSDFGSSTWLAALFGVTPIPAEYFIALCTDEPGSAMDGDILTDLEPVDAAYQRQPYWPGSLSWESNGPYLTNLKPISFPLPSVDWGYLTHYAVCSAATSGQLYAWGEIVNAQFVTATIGMQIPAGGLVLGLHALDNSIAA